MDDEERQSHLLPGPQFLGPTPPRIWHGHKSPAVRKPWVLCILNPGRNSPSPLPCLPPNTKMALQSRSHREPRQAFMLCLHLTPRLASWLLNPAPHQCQSQHKTLDLLGEISTAQMVHPQRVQPPRPRSSCRRGSHSHLSCASPHPGP